MFQLPPPEPLAPQPGERKGGLDGRRFEILRGLGRGGMGQVVRARDEVLHRIVALKFISPGWEFTGRALDKLLQEEARPVAQLDHENIVRIFDVSERLEGGLPFLIMECLEGQSLEALLKREPAGAAARPAHPGRHHGRGWRMPTERQIIHRDLKPSNVFILPDGRVKLLDFGLARFASSLGRGTCHARERPAYMAPEQWRGRAQDQRTDLWAAGRAAVRDAHRGAALSGRRPGGAARAGDLRGARASGAHAPAGAARGRGVAAGARRWPRSPPAASRPRTRCASGCAEPGAARCPPAPRRRPHARIPQRRQVTLVCCWLSGPPGRALRRRGPE